MFTPKRVSTMRLIQRSKVGKAKTIHKSQGSEYPVVILPFYMQYCMMLSRNLVYTGLTRASKLAIVIGLNKAIGITVKQFNQRQRYTRLKERLESQII